MDLESNGQTEEPDRQAKPTADAAALDLVKQLITLAAGVLALSATFIEKIGPRSPSLLIILAASWLALIISVFAGLQTMSVIVKSRLTGNDEWSKGRGKSYARISKYGFVLGIALFALFAFFLLVSVKAKTEQPAQVHGLVHTQRHAPRARLAWIIHEVSSQKSKDALKG